MMLPCATQSPSNVAKIDNKAQFEFQRGKINTSIMADCVLEA